MSRFQKEAVGHSVSSGVIYMLFLVQDSSGVCVGERVNYDQSQLHYSAGNIKSHLYLLHFSSLCLMIQNIIQSAHLQCVVECVHVLMHTLNSGRD